MSHFREDCNINKVIDGFKKHYLDVKYKDLDIKYPKTEDLLDRYPYRIEIMINISKRYSIMFYNLFDYMSYNLGTAVIDNDKIVDSVGFFISNGAKLSEIECDSLRKILAIADDYLEYTRKLKMGKGNKYYP